MSGKRTDGGLLDEDEDDDGDGDNDGRSPSSDSEGDEAGGDSGGSAKDSKSDKDYFRLPSNLSSSGSGQYFKGISKNKKTCEVEVTVRLPARCVPCGVDRFPRLWLVSCSPEKGLSPGGFAAAAGLLPILLLFWISVLFYAQEVQRELVVFHMCERDRLD